MHVLIKVTEPVRSLDSSCTLAANSLLNKYRCTVYKCLCFGARVSWQGEGGRRRRRRAGPASGGAMTTMMAIMMMMMKTLDANIHLLAADPSAPGGRTASRSFPDIKTQSRESKTACSVFCSFRCLGKHTEQTPFRFFRVLSGEIRGPSAAINRTCCVAMVTAGYNPDGYGLSSFCINIDKLAGC